MVKIGINGFGRIGRLVLRDSLKRDDIEVVAINSLRDAKSNAHLFKYDSVHGTYDGEVVAGDNELIVDGKRVKILNGNEPKDIDWGSVGAEIVLESTGKFTSGEACKDHLRDGVKK